MGKRVWICRLLLAAALFATFGAAAQDDGAGKRTRAKKKKAEQLIIEANEAARNRRFTVAGGVVLGAGADSTAGRHLDSLVRKALGADSVLMDSLKLPYSLKQILASMARDTAAFDTVKVDSIVTARMDELAAEKRRADSLAADTLRFLSNRELRRLERERIMSSPDYRRYSAIFRDTMPLSRMAAISVVVPGFSQLHNKQYWKIPVLYGTAGTSLAFMLKENKTYKRYKTEYDDLVAHQAERDKIDPVQTKMIRHNTTRQLCMAGMVASYMYFLGDGVVNYPSQVSSIKKATTLSTMCPGAGQVYNGSYWKVPVVLGGFATMAYIIDFNNRGYKRFKRAYDLLTDGDDTTVDEFEGRYKDTYLKNLKNNYRRNRDLSIIGTVGFYLLNIIDAHVDAHLKDFDISDDLSVSLTPAMLNLSTQTSRNVNAMGMSLNVTF